jgi:hypothetical protein
VENPLVSCLTALVRIASLTACLIVVIAFIVFATHQATDASTQQVADLGSAGAIAAHTKAVDAKPSTLRQAVTDASNTLTSPFHNVLGTSDQWGMHVSQLVIALLLYGFGVGFVMRAVRLRHE